MLSNEVTCRVHSLNVCLNLKCYAETCECISSPTFQTTLLQQSYVHVHPFLSSTILCAILHVHVQAVCSQLSYTLTVFLPQYTSSSPKDLVMRWSWSMSDSPGKSGSPVSISANREPIAHTSTALYVRIIIYLYMYTCTCMRIKYM